MSDGDELGKIVWGEYAKLPPSRYPHESVIADAILSSDWLARVKRAAKAEGWWEGVNDQWKHRPVGNRVLETDNPHREQVTE